MGKVSEWIECINGDNMTRQITTAEIQATESTETLEAKQEIRYGTTSLCIYG